MRWHRWGAAPTPESKSDVAMRFDFFSFTVLSLRPLKDVLYYSGARPYGLIFDD